MFESVAPETFVPQSRKVFYESLPVSIAVHVALSAAIVAAGTWRVAFPSHSPRMAVAYQLETPLPVPPPPPPPPRAAAQPLSKPAADVPVGRLPDLAPTIIPDAIPEVPVSVVEEQLPILDASLVTVAQGVEGGMVGGVADGVEGGEIGGTIGGEVGSVAPPDTVIVKRDMPLPTTPLSMTFPEYPDEARVRRWEDMIVVRYIIGKNGRVREVTVLNHPEREIFEKVAVKAIRGWRFRPYRKDGVAQEVIHELTVFFKLV